MQPWVRQPSERQDVWKVLASMLVGSCGFVLVLSCLVGGFTGERSAAPSGGRRMGGGFQGGVVGAEGRLKALGERRQGVHTVCDGG